MKTSWVLVLCIAMAGTLAYGQSGDAGYQTATVVSIDKVAADARHPEKAGEYKVAMRMGNTLYMCQSSASPAAFLDWSPNKEFPTKLDGKILLVNGPHGPVELNITGKKAAK